MKRRATRKRRQTALDPTNSSPCTRHHGGLLCSCHRHALSKGNQLEWRDKATTTPAPIFSPPARNSPLPVRRTQELQRSLSVILYSLRSICILSISEWSCSSAWFVFPGIDLPDESVYLFQARSLLTGHLTAEAPPPTVTNSPALAKTFGFDHHILFKDRWFGKYPPGWPAILAIGLALHLEWLVNPLLGLAVLLITQQISRHLFGDSVSRTALCFLIASPFFTMNFVGYMSHPACALFLTLATLFALRGSRSHSSFELYLMVLCLAASFWVRPFTAVCMGFVLFVYVFWALREHTAKLLRLGFVAGMVGVGLFSSLLIYNRALSGSLWITPYALARRTDFPIELSFAFSSILRNIRAITLYSVGDTLAASFCFVFILAAYGLFREREHRQEAYVLAGLFVCLVLGHLLQKETSTSYIGERYYVEAYFAVAILAARGWWLYRTRWNLTPIAVGRLVVLLVFLQIFQFVAYSRTAFLSRHAYHAVEATAEDLNLRNAIVFMGTRSEYFQPHWFNANQADWKHAEVVYLRDPGSDHRSEVTRVLHRTNWVLITYLDPQRKAIVEASGYDSDRVEPAS